MSTNARVVAWSADDIIPYQEYKGDRDWTAYIYLEIDGQQYQVECRHKTEAGAKAALVQYLTLTHPPAPTAAPTDAYTTLLNDGNKGIGQHMAQYFKADDDGDDVEAEMSVLEDTSARALRGLYHTLTDPGLAPINIAADLSRARAQE